MGETFKLPEVCSHRTWYGRTRNGTRRPGWKDDPLVKEALKRATDRAQWWQDNESAREIQRAQEKLARYSPGAVERIRVLMDSAESEQVQLKAAGEILDRAAVSTAPKVDVTFDVENWQRKREERLAAVEGLEDWEG
jgi:hypothetical protein